MRRKGMSGLGDLEHQHTCRPILVRKFMKISTFLSIVVFSIILSGCTVFWPGGFQVQRADKEVFEVWYDPLLTHPGVLDDAAKRHCNSFGMNFEISKTMHGGGIVSNKIWYRCIPQA